ncbi:MAG: hypothetical protein H7Y09_13290 [Chitinophagaceae bacterium]|nr:hypothetical protein [Anaerolineae bacterium]
MSDSGAINANQLPKFSWDPRQFFQWLTRPHPSVIDIETFRQSSLLAAMIIVSDIVGIILIITLLALDPGQINAPDVVMMIVGAALLPVAYLLNRAGKYELGATFFVLLLYIIFIVPAFADGSGSASLAFAALAILMAGLFFETRRFLISVFVALAWSGFMIFSNMENPSSAVSEDSTSYFAVLFFLVLISVLISTFILHLRTIETLRRRDLETANEALRASEAILEQRVIERTHQLETARNQAEAAQQEAERANQVKSQFLANMSHELRTPLNAILNFTAFVADGVMGPVNDEQVEALMQSISSGKHLLALINDVLDITKIEAGMMDMFIQEVDLNEAVGVVVSMAKGLVKNRSITLETTIEDRLPITYGDKRRLRQVLLNIVSNAVKFTREGSVTVRAMNLGHSVRFEVQDTGLGIASEDQSLVFESFKQAKHDLLDTPGTGLGMPISKFFVEAHGGRIWFESTLDVGSTFFIELPVLTENEANSLASKNDTMMAYA